MKLALLGHGAMGQLVERLAREAGDEVATVLGSREAAFGAEELAEILGGHDAAIDFTVADAVPRHAEACALARVPLVEGTTGWHTKLEEVRRLVEREQGALVYGANFSVGVNLFYRVVARAPRPPLHRLRTASPAPSRSPASTQLAMSLSPPVGVGD